MPQLSLFFSYNRNFFHSLIISFIYCLIITLFVLIKQYIPNNLVILIPIVEEILIGLPLLILIIFSRISNRDTLSNIVPVVTLQIKNFLYLLGDFTYNKLLLIKHLLFIRSNLILIYLGFIITLILCVCFYTGILYYLFCNLGIILLTLKKIFIFTVVAFFIYFTKLLIKENGWYAMFSFLYIRIFYIFVLCSFEILVDISIIIDYQFDFLYMDTGSGGPSSNKGVDPGNGMPSGGGKGPSSIKDIIYNNGKFNREWWGRSPPKMDQYDPNLKWEPCKCCATKACPCGGPCNPDLYRMRGVINPMKSFCVDEWHTRGLPSEGLPCCGCKKKVFHFYCSKCECVYCNTCHINKY